MENLKKAELLSALAEKTGLTKTDAETFLKGFAEVVTETIATKNVPITGLGTFKQRVNSAREGINPSTKEKIQIKESVGLAFKQSGKVKDQLNA